MPSAVLAIQWDNYAGTAESPGLFSIEPLAYNSRQSRLHELSPGDKLWLVSRHPDDRQYYFVAVLTVEAHRRNEPSSTEAKRYGDYAILADPATSHDLARRFPAEPSLRTLTYSTNKPISADANIGQSLQSIRFLTDGDQTVLNTELKRILSAD